MTQPREKEPALFKVSLASDHTAPDCITQICYLIFDITAYGVESVLEPENVFTPRSATLNQQMYVERPDLEEKITNALTGEKYIIIYGESGNGKTWLYKKVFYDRNVHFETINLGSANVTGDILTVVEDKLGQGSQETTEKRELTITAGARPMGVGAETNVKSTFAPIKRSPILQLFEFLRATAKTRKSVLVFDNFEQIIDNKDLLDQIKGILLQVDDEAYAKEKIKIMIVGVPGNIKNIISNTANAATISNRIVVMPEVGRLTSEQSNTLMDRGFFEKLGLKTAIDKEKIFHTVNWTTDRIAQHVHELCLQIARKARKNEGIIDEEILRLARIDWQQETLDADCAIIDNLMNSRETKAGRKNQTLYALGLCDKEEFKYTDIEAIVRKEFTKGTDGVKLDVSGLLSKFSKDKNNIIKKSPKGDVYRFVSPKYRMAIRALLKRTQDGRIEK